MTESMLAMFGMFGGACVIGFAAGMFPILSVELFLVGLSTWAAPTIAGGVALVLLAALGHQIAKSICYVAGVGALEHANARLHARLERARAKIDRWNRRPKVIMFLAATIGLPPMYLLAFVAKPLMNMRFGAFTVISLGGRIGRYAFLMLIPQLVG